MFYSLNNKAFKRLFSNVKKKKDYKKKKRGNTNRLFSNKSASLINNGTITKNTVIHNHYYNTEKRPAKSKSRSIDITGIISILLTLGSFLWEFLFKKKIG